MNYQNQMNPYIQQALTLLTRNYLLDVISLLRQYAISKRKSSAMDTLDSIEQSYRFLLKYLTEGVADPGRERMYADLRYRLYALICQLQTDEVIDDSNDVYYATLRNVRFSHTTFADALGRYLSADATLQLVELRDAAGETSADAKGILDEKNRALKDIFSVVMSLPVGATAELEAIVNVAANADMAFGLRALITSALTLGALHTYDSHKLLALLEIDQKCGNPRLRARALTGILLLLNRYSSFMQPDYTLDSRFESWSDDLTNYPRLREVVYALVRARGSSRLMQKIEKEIMPGITGLGKDFFANLKNEKGEINLDDLAENPEWEKIMRESGLDKKLRKLHDMHNNGADMMISIFNQMANHYFFKDADSWFRCFEEWDGARLGLNEKLTSMITSMPPFMPVCDTDKYAMALNLSRIPAGARDMMNQALTAQQSEASEEMKEMMLHTSQPEFALEAMNYARMLYRFFTYFRFRSNFENPFDKGIKFSFLPYVGELINEDEILHNVGETYFHQGFYTDAASIYKQLLEKGAENAAMLNQKIGYCYEKSELFSMALDYYKRAALLSKGHSTDRWILERLYRMAEKVDDRDAMREALDELVSLDADNMNYLKGWLKLTLKNGSGSEVDGEMSDLVEKRISKLLYFLPDDHEAQRVAAEAAWLKSDYAKVISVMSARRGDIEMYLAANSLGAGADSKSEEDVGDDAASSGNAAAAKAAQATEMSADLLLIASAHAARDEYAEAIEALRLLRHFNTTLHVDDTAAQLVELWRSSDTLKQHQTMIPMLIEAALLPG